MNRRFVLCLLASIAVGSAAAVTVTASGWGLLAGLAVYSLAGSLTLVTATLIVQPGEAPAARRVRVDERVEDRAYA